MALENATQIQQLVPTNPEGGDHLAEADNHMRMIKTCLQTSLPNMTAPWTTTSQISCGEPVADGDVVTKGWIANNSFHSIGEPFLWMLPTLPAGNYIDLDGQALSRTTYATLFALYGTYYGAGDGSTTFNVPDARGYALRVFNNGGTVDPDAATRTAPRPNGTVTGDAVGTVQLDQNKAHTHAIKYTYNMGAGGADAYRPFSGTGFADDGVQPEGGTEARMRNLSIRLVMRTK